MDLIKIGKFIAECRKNKKITQEELAEKLYITDRAVSKWERGLSLPDADKMIDLCNILGINVNELLNGEKIAMKDYNKKTEELLVEMAKQEELKNKKIFNSMYLVYITVFIFYIGIVGLASYALEEGPVLLTIVIIATIIMLVISLFAFRFEVNTGYYECDNCHHKYASSSYFKALMAPHFGTTRYMKCPNCGKRSWIKKPYFFINIYAIIIL